MTKPNQFLSVLAAAILLTACVPRYDDYPAGDAGDAKATGDAAKGDKRSGDGSLDKPDGWIEDLADIQSQDLTDARDTADSDSYLPPLPDLKDGGGDVSDMKDVPDLDDARPEAGEVGSDLPPIFDTAPELMDVLADEVGQPDIQPDEATPCDGSVYGDGACGPACGDGECGEEEMCDNCPEDCGDCPECPNNLCEVGENCFTCIQDCPCGENESCDQDSKACVCSFTTCGDTCCQEWHECNDETMCCDPDCTTLGCDQLNGCGELCGCAQGYECCDDGVCKEPGCCQPPCEGKECGDDGCGGSCGECQGEQDLCVEGLCECQPACDGKECGDDGCDGACGTCDDGQFCNGLETCDDGTGNCLDGAPPNIDDDVACTVDACDFEAQEIMHTPDDDACDDLNSCTDDWCHLTMGCQHAPVQDGTECDDGEDCTLADSCQAGECQAGEWNLGDPPNCPLDWDHDGIVEGDLCPFAFDPGNPDVNGLAGPDACEALAVHGDFQYQRSVTLSQGGGDSAWRRTHEPVELPLVNGIIDESVVGYWRLDGNFEEYHGYQGTTTVGSPEAVEGVFDDASGGMHFEGDSGAYVWKERDFRFGAEFTVSVWLKSPPQKDVPLVANWTGDKCHDNGWQLAWQNDKLQFRVCLGPSCGLDNVVLIDSPAPSEDAWHHVAGVTHGDVIELFVDGRLAGSQKFGGLPQDFDCGNMISLANAFHFVDQKGYWFGEASLDELLIFNRALMPDEIETYYRSGAPYGTRYVPGSQADFDDVRVTEKTGDGDGDVNGDVNGNESVKRSRVIGPRPHSDTVCPMGEDDGTWAYRDDLCGVVGYWRLDGDGTDVMGKYDGTAGSLSAGAVLGRFGDAGGSMQFGGSGLSAPGEGLLIGESWTVELWFQANAALGQCEKPGPIFNKDKSGVNQGDVEMYFSLASECKISATVKNTTIQSDVGKDYWRVGNWHHLALVWSTAMFIIYVDGIPQSNPYSLPNPVDLPDNGAGLLFARDLSGNWFDGAFDEVIIHNVAKSPDYIYHRANPGVPKLRFLANTVVKNQGDEITPKYPLREYNLYWGDEDAGLAVPEVTSLASAPDYVPDSCHGLLNGCLGYAGWWRFNEGRGAVAVDSSQNKNSGDIEGPHWTDGIEGIGLEFGGDGGHVAVSNDETLMSVGAVTLESYLSVHAFPHPAAAVVSKVVGQGNAEYHLLAYGDAPDSKGELHCDGLGHAGKTDKDLILSGFAGQVACTLGGAAAVYVNGGNATQSTSQLAAGALGSNLWLGAGIDWPGEQSLDGTLDSVRIMNRALTTDEFLHFPLVDWKLETGNWQLDCGGIVCPELSGYDVDCNVRDHCEYANQDISGHKKWDVWIYMSPGSFRIGSPIGSPGHNQKEEPETTITFEEGYLIGKYEVVVEQHEACVDAEPAGCSPAFVDPGAPSISGWGLNTSDNGRADHPQNGLTWQQARDFCQWIAPGGHLTSEAEWEYAAEGPVYRKYPWGNAPEPTCSNGTAIFDDGGYPAGLPWACNPCEVEGCSGTGPVGTLPNGASYCGALNMAGNATEWVEDDDHGNLDGVPLDGTAWTGGGTGSKTHKGGDFSSWELDRLRPSHRNGASPDYKYASIGARCARPVLDCYPDCTGKACGPDGCGGNCGECAEGENCSGGLCVDPSDCPGGGESIGDDCGVITEIGCCDNEARLYWCSNGKLYCEACNLNDSGTCGWSFDAEEYACWSTGGYDPSGETPKSCFGCTSDCDGKLCGDDGCGGSCGGCEAGKICIDFECVVPVDCPGVGVPLSNFCGDIPQAGCCDDLGRNFVCNDAGLLVCDDCASKGSGECGWDENWGNYECWDSEGDEDPSGKVPKVCWSNL